MVSAFATNREPAGDGAQMVAQVISQMIDERILVQRTDAMYATVIDSNTIELDKDGFPLYKDQGDFYVLNGATLVAGARIVVVPIVGVRGKIVVLGEWIDRSGVGATITAADGYLPVNAGVHHVTAAGGDIIGLTPVANGFKVILIFDEAVNLATSILFFLRGLEPTHTTAEGEVLEFVQINELQWSELGRA